jgi:hypothetical protein
MKKDNNKDCISERLESALHKDRYISLGDMNDVRKTRPTILLHSCCGPCSTAVVERLRGRFDITVFFYNPNITDRDEYEKRKKTQLEFIEKYNNKFGIYIEKIDNEAVSCMMNYSWPGNIRELENVIERAYNFVEGNIIMKEHLPDKIVKNNIFQPTGDLNYRLNELEKHIILDTLKDCRGNKSKAAVLLGINRAGLYQKLKKHKIKE